MPTWDLSKTTAVQTAGKSIDDLAVLKATLQPRNGIYMMCKPRA